MTSWFDRSEYGLRALPEVNVFNDNLLLSFAAMFIERRYLAQKERHKLLRLLDRNIYSHIRLIGIHRPAHPFHRSAMCCHQL